MYSTSLLFTTLTISLAFFFLNKRFARFNLYLYSSSFFIAALTRPYALDAIDNTNLANYLTSKSLWGLKEEISYNLIYNLTLPFEDYRFKIFIINFLSLIILVISIWRFIIFFRNSKYHKINWNIYTFLITLILPTLCSSLYMIHLRQFLAFSIILLLISFLIKPSKYNILICSFCPLLVGLTHPIYLLFFLSLVPFTAKYFKSIKQVNFFLSSLTIWIYKYRKRLILPFLLILFYFGYQFYLFAFSFVPFLNAYAFVRDIELEANTLYFVPIILLIFTQLNSVKSYSQFIIKSRLLPLETFSFKALNIYSIILLSSILVIASVEFFTPTIYAIGRVKTALYPSLFISIVLLGFEKNKSKLFLNSFLIITFALAIYYSFYTRIMAL